MPDDPSSDEKQQVLLKEGERLIKAVDSGSYLIVLDVTGKLIYSEELSEKLASLALSGQSDITFVIGGSFGLSLAILAAANERISFSHMPSPPNDPLATGRCQTSYRKPRVRYMAADISRLAYYGNG